MKALSWLLYIVGIGFCIVGFTRHSAAWAAAAMCFFAATMNLVREKGGKSNMKKRVGIGSISLLLVIIALVWSYSIFGFCLGDNVLSAFHLPVWSNGNEQIKNGWRLFLSYC